MLWLEYYQVLGLNLLPTLSCTLQPELLSLASAAQQHHPHVTTAGGGDLGITFPQLRRWVHGLYSAVNGGQVRLACSTALSQWAERHVRGNNIGSQCAPHHSDPKCWGYLIKDPVSLTYAHFFLLLLLRWTCSHVFNMVSRSSFLHSLCLCEEEYFKGRFSSSLLVWNLNLISVELNHLLP